METILFADLQDGLLSVYLPFITVFLAVVAAGGVFGSVLVFCLDWFSDFTKRDRSS